MSNGPNQSNPPIPLDGISLGYEESSQDTVLLELVIAGKGHRYSYSREAFFQWMREQLGKAQPEFQVQLIDTLKEIEKNLGNLCCHCPPKDEGGDSKDRKGS